MAKLTILFGILLIALGVTGFVLTGSAHPTSLIPAIFGILLIIFGALAHTPETRRRMLFMHIAVTVGLVGCLFTLPGLFSLVQLIRGKLLLNHPAIEEKAAMSVLMLIYVLLCVRSFIIARRTRI
jgi:hypothetical protein